MHGLPTRRTSARAKGAAALLGASPVAVIEVDRTGAVRTWNPAAESLFGWPAAELLGRPLPETIIKSVAGIARLADRLAAAQVQPTLWTRCRHRTGRLLQIEVRPTALYDRRGQVRAILAVCTDVSSRRRMESQLRYQAGHDSLTHLPNRDLLLTRIDAALAADARAGCHTGVLMIDLDKFKEVNDTLGHTVGDQLLAQIGPRLLAGTVRDRDLVARLSGDEFAVLLPGLADPDAAVTIAERVLDALHSPFHLAETSADVAASIGIALAPDHGQDGSDLLRHADTAMYRAKDTSAGIVVYQPEVDQQTPTRFGLLGQLRRAFDRDELLVYYQPKIDVASGRPAGAEALVRWRHPERGVLGPGEFLPVIEATALINRLTDHVLETALAQAASWADSGHPVPVSVNLSARGLHDRALAERVLAAVDRVGLPPDLLYLEVTETAVMRDPDGALAVLGELADAGIRLSLDDYGTGYSSMSYLQRLPVNELKVDKSFVTGLSGERTDNVLVRSAIDLGHNLDLTVVAEGVEDADTLAVLHHLRCDLAQGYHIARPMPADEFTAWLSRSAPQQPGRPRGQNGASLRPRHAETLPEVAVTA